MSAATLDVYQNAADAAAELSQELSDDLGRMGPEDQAACLAAGLATSRTLFQPWSMEILYLTGLFTTIRFSRLERLLGISSRTLSNKLRRLTEDGLLERQVFDEQPVRVEYRLTPHGRTAAALATPLFTYLGTQD